VLPYVECEFNAVTKILLVENTADVAFNSSQAKVKLAGDFFVAEAASYGFRYTPFCIC
jgi:hypothetical protein